MKKLFFSIIMAISPSLLFSQNILLNESFNSSTFPPAGWTIDNQTSNWVYSNTINAGGAQGELYFQSLPSFFGTTRFISPTIDLSSTSNVSLEFLNVLYYNTSITFNGKIGVATRSAGGNWSSIWEVNITGDLPAHTETIAINNADAAASDFQFCFYFTGMSEVAEFYIDNINLISSTNHDVSTLKIIGNESVYNTNDIYTTDAIVKNVGLNTETFDVVCTIYDENNNQLFTNTQTVSNLASSTTDTVHFTGYTLANSNALYKVKVNTTLANDQNINNNTVYKNLYTYTTNRDQVVLEIGTGTWCYACQGAALATDDFTANGDDIAIIEYHSADDFSTTTGEDKLNYYGAPGYPAAYFDGIEEYVGGGTSSIYNQYLPLYNNRKDIKTGVTIDLNTTVSNGTYSVNVDLTKVGPIADTNLVLYLVLTESNINFAWQNLNELDFVQRLTLPNSNGEPVDLVSNTNLSHQFNFQLDNTWNNDLEVVVFVQNLDTKEILNGSKSLLPNVNSIAEIETFNSLSIYPNPTTNTVNIENNSDLTIDVYNIYSLNGKLVKSGNIKTSIKTIDLSDLEKGIYLISLYSSNQIIETKKLIIE